MKFLVCLALAVVAASVVEARETISYSFPTKRPFVKPEPRSRVWGGKYSVDDDAYDELDSDFSTTPPGLAQQRTRLKLKPRLPRVLPKVGAKALRLKKTKRVRPHPPPAKTAAHHSLDDDAYDELDSDFSTITPGPLGPHHPHRKHKMLKKKRAMRRNQRHPATAASHSLDDDAYDELDSDFSTITHLSPKQKLLRLKQALRRKRLHPTAAASHSVDDDAYDELDSDFSTTTAGPSGPHHPHRKHKMLKKKRAMRRNQRHPAAAASHSLDDDAYDELDADFGIFSNVLGMGYGKPTKPMKPLLGYPKSAYYSLDDDAYDELDSDFSTVTGGPLGTQHPGHRRIHPFHHHRKSKKSMKVPRALLGPRKVSAAAGHSLDDSAFGELD